MTQDRIELFKNLVEKHPDNPMNRFSLASEYLKNERFEEAVVAFQDYLTHHKDEGNAYGRLGEALHHLGRTAEARQAYEKGIEVATEHRHLGMAGEFEDILADLDD